MGFLRNLCIGGITAGSILLAYYWPAAPQRRIVGRVILIGDSLTDSPGYVSRLREGLEPGIKIRKVALPGEGTEQIKDAGLEASALFRPDVAIVLTGVNDLASGRGWLHAAKHLDELYRGLDEMGANVVAVQLTPWDAHLKGRMLQKATRALNQWIEEHPVPKTVVGTSNVGGQGRDGLHLTRKGGKQLAEAVLSSVYM